VSRRVLVGLAIVVVATALFFGIRARRDFVDLEVYRTAAIRALHAEPLYRPDDGHYQFKYWPAFAVAMAPLAFVSAETAKWLWFVGSIVLLGYFLTHAIRVLPDRRATERWLVWWTLAVTAKFIVKELVNGQTNVLLGLLALSAGMSLARRRPILAGLAVGIAAFVKPYGLLLVPWLAVAAGIPAMAAAAATIVAGLCLPASLYGLDGNLSLLHDWYSTVTTTTAPNLLNAENISFATMWAKWIGAGPSATALTWLTAACSLVVAGAVCWRRRSVGHPEYLESGLLVLLMPVLSPQGWDYVLIAAVPAFVCLLDRLRQMGPAWRGVTVVGFALTSLTIFDLLGRALYMRAMAASVMSVGAILLIAALAHLRWRRLA